MEKSQIREIIKTFLETEFEYTGITVTDSLDLSENVYFDSLNAVKVILFLENKFNLKFTAAELSQNIFFQLGHMTDFVFKKLN